MTELVNQQTKNSPNGMGCLTASHMLLLELQAGQARRNRHAGQMLAGVTCRPVEHVVLYLLAAAVSPLFVLVQLTPGGKPAASARGNAEASSMFPARGDRVTKCCPLARACRSLWSRSGTLCLCSVAPLFCEFARETQTSIQRGKALLHVLNFSWVRAGEVLPEPVCMGERAEPQRLSCPPGSGLSWMRLPVPVTKWSSRALAQETSPGGTRRDLN
ncbi:uncharacterized protein [Struthio camelus]|uniref:uncharacterized protein n=1 Tax=Struthio camelus TaxID=8801 RepID=UPI003603EA5C